MKFDYTKPMTELFIEKHKDKINWHGISRNQKLSEQFKIKHKNKVYQWAEKYFNIYNIYNEIRIQ